MCARRLTPVCRVVQSLQGETDMWEQLHRNIYAGDVTKVDAAKRLAVYVQRCAMLVPQGAAHGHVMYVLSSAVHW